MIKVGTKMVWGHIVTHHTLKAFAEVSGDINPVHMSETYAATTRFGKRIAHGMLSGAWISAALAEALGEGAIYLRQTLEFLNPIFIGDQVDVEIEVREVVGRKVTLDTRVLDRTTSKIAVIGTAILYSPMQE